MSARFSISSEASSGSTNNSTNGVASEPSSPRPRSSSGGLYTAQSTAPDVAAATNPRSSNNGGLNAASPVFVPGGSRQKYNHGSSSPLVSGGPSLRRENLNPATPAYAPREPSASALNPEAPNFPGVALALAAARLEGSGGTPGLPGWLGARDGHENPQAPEDFAIEPLQDFGGIQSAVQPDLLSDNAAPRQCLAAPPVFGQHSIHNLGVPSAQHPAREAKKKVKAHCRHCRGCSEEPDEALVPQIVQPKPVLPPDIPNVQFKRPAPLPGHHTATGWNDKGDFFFVHLPDAEEESEVDGGETGGGGDTAGKEDEDWAQPGSLDGSGHSGFTNCDAQPGPFDGAGHSGSKSCDSKSSPPDGVGHTGDSSTQPSLSNIYGSVAQRGIPGQPGPGRSHGPGSTEDTPMEGRMSWKMGPSVALPATVHGAGRKIRHCSECGHMAACLWSGSRCLSNRCQRGRYR